MTLRLFFNFILVLLVSYSCTNSDQEQAIVKKYEPNFESLKQHEAAPEWFQDAKLGMYFHWGPYSVPAYGSAWYPSNMYMRGSDVNKFHEKNFGPIEEFGYEDWIRRLYPHVYR